MAATVIAPVVPPLVLIVMSDFSGWNSSTPESVVLIPVVPPETVPVMVTELSLDTLDIAANSALAGVSVPEPVLVLPELVLPPEPVLPVFADEEHPANVVIETAA